MRSAAQVDCLMLYYVLIKKFSVQIKAAFLWLPQGRSIFQPVFPTERNEHCGEQCQGKLLKRLTNLQWVPGKNIYVNEKNRATDMRRAAVLVEAPLQNHRRR